MSRDFKQEYTQYMNEQTPDLWARIEANLPAKETPVVTISELLEKKTNKALSKKAGRLIAYGITAAAALLVCFVALPGLRGMGGFGAKNDSANMLAFDAGMRSAFDVAQDSAVTEGMMMEEGVMEVAEEADVNIFATPAEPEEKTEEKTAAGSMKTDQATQQVAEQKAVRVKVQDVFEIEGKMVYTVTGEGAEVRCVLAESFSEDTDLVVGEEYLLVMEKAEADAHWDYEIVGIQ